MHYIIDGHNLIGQCRTVRLGDPDDEAQLVDLLHRWLLRLPQHEITVVFDGGVYGHPVPLDRNGVRAVFAHSPQDADTRLLHLINRVTDPKRCRLVSSDRAVADAGLRRGMEVLRSAEFARQIERPPGAAKKTSRRARPEPKLPRTEVDSWLQEFGADEE